MTAKEVIETVATMPQEEWVKVQRGIADLITAKFTSGEVAEIREALAEAEAEFERGDGMSSKTIRSKLGLA